MKKIPSIVLASASPRRKEILTHLGLEPKIVVSDADETVNESVTPEALTEILSKRKAQAVKELVAPDELVIASDTVVAKGDTVFGKPHSKKEALTMLSALSGCTHKVISGIALMQGDRISVSHDTTYVTFRPLSESEIISYIESGEPFGKAGAYGIQDRASVFVQKLDGDYFNVVGLPVFKMFSMLTSDYGLDLFDLIGQNEASTSIEKWKEQNGL
jgi:septum formation protein